ncbi:family 16 glycosylhydrolase [Caulobacter sp. S45]|uniref:glycoside hydrolase family 16 protein n=1 Tax=Caulobacter sp. S45 TaxID=1641861 RepID=UPI00131D1054|nr:glycoside hydrolase family 16 protein [Caulobacter sp. S45]
MKSTALLVAGLCLVASSATAAPPATMDPSTLGKETFKETFAKLDAGPDATAASRPLHRWRTILKGEQTPPSPYSRTMTSTTWLGDTTDGNGPTPFTIDAKGLTINATKQGQPFGRSWRSGILNTKFTFSQLYGYFEVNADIPTCEKGTWPGIWLMPTSGAWPLHGEIDWPEAVGNGHYYWTAHSAASGKGTQVQVVTPADCTRGFHRYGVLWGPETIAYYLDRKLVGQAPTPADYTLPMYLLIDLNVGGSWPGWPDHSLTSEKMVVRGVDVWAAR